MQQVATSRSSTRFRWNFLHRVKKFTQQKFTLKYSACSNTQVWICFGWKNSPNQIHLKKFTLLNRNDLRSIVVCVSRGPYKKLKIYTVCTFNVVTDYVTGTYRNKTNRQSTTHIISWTHQKWWELCAVLWNI